MGSILAKLNSLWYPVDADSRRFYARKVHGAVGRRSTSRALASSVAVLYGVTAGAAAAGNLPTVATYPPPTPSIDLSLLAVEPRAASTLRIENVRLERSPADAPAPSALLKFDMVNEGTLRLRDILIEIAIFEKAQTLTGGLKPRLIVRPFTIKGHVTIEPSYTVNFEMLLRNVSSECPCEADVSVVFADAVPISGS